MIDRRGQRGGGGMGGLLGLIPLLLRFRGGWIIALLLLGLTLFGGLRGFSSDPDASTTQSPVAGRRTDDKKAHFVAFVLDDTQAAWRQTFAKLDQPYRNAKLVMFTDATQTACGGGQAATGPFYCPLDERVYIDLAFYDELERRLGAKGDFAQAYVIAHEIGHHVQHQLGIDARARGARGAQRGAEGNSVRLELQADCFAGIWARSSADRKLLEPGDIDEALEAAAAIGDDRLQRQSGARVNPEKWTHGSSAERARWFKIGFEEGTIEACDTFDRGTL